MNGKIITWYIGVSLLLTAGLMLVAGILACYTPGDDSRMPLLFSAFITGVVGAYPLIFVRRNHYRLNFREGNCIMVLAWVLCCAFGMLPYLIYGHEFTLVNALFESVSGFTTTGASILTDIEALPLGLQFWRASTAWVGGIGIVTLFSMVMQGGMNKATLSGVEISHLTREQFRGQKNGFFGSKMLIVYLSLTVLTFVALVLTGMPIFDAVTNAMSACSTCGFCIRNASIAFYDSPAAEAVLTLAMLLASLNFSLVFLSFVRGSGKGLLRSSVARTYLLAVAVIAALVLGDLLLHGGYDAFFAAGRDALFQVVSIVTTTGFATVDTTQWPALSMLALVCCSIICGCAGSTSGGLKFDRFYLAVKAVAHQVRCSLTPSLVRPVRVAGGIRSETEVKDSMLFVVCYLLLIGAFGLVNALGGLDATTAFSASVASIGNVGPGFGEVGSMSNYAAIPSVLKVSSMVEMLLGRLEIYPILSLLGLLGGSR